jgi:hypothetical protein
VTCSSDSNKEKDKSKHPHYSCCRNQDSLKDQCLGDTDNSSVHEDGSDRVGEKDKLGNTYFHVEIF